MKRTNSSGNLPPTPVNTSLSDSGPTSRKIHVKKTLAPYLAADVRQRARALATETTHRSEGAKLEMRAPGVYVPDEERPHFFKLPDDVFTQIIPRLNQKAVVSMAASCRLGYFHVDRQAPMRRLPGLLGDLKRLRVGNLSFDPDSFKAFLEAIASGGDYDRALLTPLSPALRCAVTIAMQTWGSSKLLARNRITLNKHIFEFLNKNYDPDFESGAKQILEWNLKHDENRICSVAAHWPNFFANPNVSLEIRSRIFENLIDLLLLPKTKLFNPGYLFKIAMENSLTLSLLSVGVLALLEHRCNFFFNQIDQKLADLKESDPTREMLLMIDYTFKNKEFRCPYLITRQCAVFLKILDATANLPDKHVEPILLKMTATLRANQLINSVSYALPDVVLSTPFTLNQSLRKEFYEKSAASGVVPDAGAIFAYSLVDRISELENVDRVQSLMRKVSIVMQASSSHCPQFADYMARKIAGSR